MNEWIIEQLQRERYLEALREAEHGLLVRRVMMGQPRNGVGVRTLIWLGRVLAGWGQSLLARYDAGPGVCARPTCCLEG
jgi:hypothetical protein